MGEQYRAPRGGEPYYPQCEVERLVLEGDKAAKLRELRKLNEAQVPSCG